MIEPSVVRICAIEGGMRRLLGTGFVVGADLTLATCYHVIAPKGVLTPHFVAVFPGDQEVRCYVAEDDSGASLREADLVLVRPALGQTAPRMSPLPLWPAADDTIPRNVPLFFYGFASEVSVQAQSHSGNISGFDDGFGKLRVSGPVNHGDSGGPILVEDRVVAVTQSKDDALQDHGAAIPVGRLKSLLARAGLLRNHVLLPEDQAALAKILRLGGLLAPDLAARIGVAPSPGFEDIIRQADARGLHGLLLQKIEEMKPGPTALEARALVYSARLNALLRNSCHPDYVLAAYREATTNLPVKMPVDPEPIAAVNALVEHWSWPLLAFMRKLEPFLDTPEARAALNSLLLEAEARMDRPASTANTGSSELSIVFAIQQDRSDRYLLHAFVFDGSWTPVPLQGAVLGRHELKERFLEFVREVKARLPDPSRTPTLEIAVPLDWLNDEIDTYPTPVWKSSKPSGIAFPFALRSADRIFDNDLRQEEGRWRKSWERLTSAECLDALATAANDSAKLAKCRAKGAEFLVALSIDAPDDPEDAFADLIGAGMAAALWLRGPVADPASTWPSVQGLAKGDLRNLPHRTLDARKGANGQDPPSPLDGRLAFLFDDPTRQIPLRPGARQNISN